MPLPMVSLDSKRFQPGQVSNRLKLVYDSPSRLRFVEYYVDQSLRTNSKVKQKVQNTAYLFMLSLRCGSFAKILLLEIFLVGVVRKWTSLYKDTYFETLWIFIIGNNNYFESIYYLLQHLKKVIKVNFSPPFSKS